MAAAASGHVGIRSPPKNKMAPIVLKTNSSSLKNKSKDSISIVIKKSNLLPSQVTERDSILVQHNQFDVDGKSHKNYKNEVDRANYSYVNVKSEMIETKVAKTDTTKHESNNDTASQSAARTTKEPDSMFDVLTACGIPPENNGHAELLAIKQECIEHYENLDIEEELKKQNSFEESNESKEEGLNLSNFGGLDLSNL